MSRPTSRVSRVVVAGPLAPFADQYRERLNERGYTRLSVVSLERQVARLSRWLEGEGSGVERLSEARIEDYVVDQRAGGRGRSSLSRPGLVCLLEMLRDRTAIGRRDHALLVTLLRLGLRRGEVARIRLEDIDWRAGELVVVGKGARRDRLPLPADVGDAIAGYLTRGRPASQHREVFLQARAPFEPIAAGTVASTVRRACRRAGLPEVGSRHRGRCR